MPLRDRHHDKDPIWHVQLTLGAIVLVQGLLLLVVNDWLHIVIPLLELVLMAAIQLFTPKAAIFDSKTRRGVIVFLIALIAVANVAALQQLIFSIVSTHQLTAPMLLAAGGYAYITTLSTFALLYWEMDGGGPGQRRRGLLENHDFLFPQQHFIKTERGWQSTFIDYVYISLTNMTNFTSSDTIPLSRRAKVLMSIQALTSVTIIVLVIARAISTL